MAVGFPVKADYVTGDVLTANNMNDLSGTLNTIQSVEYAAGKNKIINGDFRINQRAFTSNTTTAAYNFDRWFQSNAGTTGTLTVTPQTFTPGAAPIAGYEGSTFFQGITAAGASADTFASFAQRIEDVRTFAGQTITFSFFARATSGTPKIGLEISQFFGSGGSPSATAHTQLGAITISTSWARYSLSIAVPSISGKTIGTTANTSFFGCNLYLSSGTDLATRASSIGLQNNTFQIWGVQVEASTIASDFQTATGTIQGELAACQRYYFLLASGSTGVLGTGLMQASNRMHQPILFPVTMRTTPTLVATSGTNYYNFQTGSDDNFNSLTINTASTQSCYIFNNSEISGTAGQAGTTTTNNASASVAFSAEL